MKKQQPKRKPQDATLRNVRAAASRDSDVRNRLAALERKVARMYAVMAHLNSGVVNGPVLD